MGTTFSYDTASIQEVRPTNPTDPSFSSPLILVVDDDSDMRFLLRQIMEQEKYRVIEAESGEEGLAAFSTYHPDIVLLDGLLPTMDGFAVCARMQTLPGGSHTPVLIITGLNDNDSVNEAFKAGATDYITKPIHRAVLRQRVKRLLQTHQAEAVLRLRERAIAATSNGIMITDPRQPGNPIIYVNSAFSDLSGYSQEAVLSRGWAILDGPDTDLAAIEQIQKAVSGVQETQVVLRHYRKNGSWFWDELSVYPVYDLNGQLSNFVGVMHDVTERKQAEEELREERDFISTILDTAGALVVVLDRQGRIVRFNRACEVTTEYTFEEVKGRYFWQAIVPSDQTEAVKVTFERLMSGQWPSEFESYVLTKRNYRRLVAWSNTALLAPDESVKFIIATGIDISERKQVEEELYEVNQQLTTRLNELNQRTQEITLLSEMGGLFQACRRTEEGYGVVSQMALQLFPRESGALFIKEANQQLTQTISWGTAVSTSNQTFFWSDECWALRRGRIHAVEDTRRGLICKHVQDDLVPASYVCIPMIAQGASVGVLHLRNGLGEGSLPVSKQQLALTVAEQIGMALANLNLQETLQNQSVRDPLTGLFNRRYLEEALERETRRVSRNGRSIGIIMLDIDHFKLFNDNYGHEMGDRVLKEVANFLQSSIRGEDFACRYGGEEFILVLPEISAEDALFRAEVIRQNIKELNLELDRFKLEQITLSAGVAVYSGGGETAENTIRLADAALYRAKQQGRDKVVLSEPS